ncbi:hypothetical protein OSSY52_12400 [Tepiditoga spiralis]|uniref:GGDEF domain-containing protein n=1 Tax=Tepiditoga spiralis TaxID=2108365 RepID=A0A7G1GBI5_9BACT|nr:diguanylate cyclase [Tepiditoga spiralis]BBE31099.1 hypothetical protein OSSY52_12400 [Tepiditoga spiralis]
MNSIYSVYLNTKNLILKEKIELLLRSNNIDVEFEDIFNSDFAIVDNVLRYAFPHIAIIDNVKSLENLPILKNETIDFILEDYSEKILKLKLQNAIYFVLARGSRGAFKQRVLKELDKIKRSGGSFSLAVISILDFNEREKQISQFSLDEVSKEILKLIKLSMRKSDDVLKISRKEFGVVLPFTELRNTETACERIKRRIKKLEKNLRGIKLAFGITEVVNPNESIETIMERLKKALYISEGNRGEISFL